MVEVILEATARVLVRHGYAETNTNLIAKTAGVGIGSVYQYFPNKDSIIVALHHRHALQMRKVMVDVLSRSNGSTLREAVDALVRALLKAHRVEPELHRILEVEFPLDLRTGGHPFNEDISRRVRELLEDHRREIRQTNMELAVYIILNVIKHLVHQTVSEPFSNFTSKKMENAIADVVLGYLLLPAPAGKGKGCL